MLWQQNQNLPKRTRVLVTSTARLVWIIFPGLRSRVLQNVGWARARQGLGGGWNIFWDEQESCSLRGKQTSPGLEFQFMITFTSPLVCYTAGFSVVTHGKVPLSWALGDNTKDGCFRNSFYLTVTGSWRKGLTV